MSRKDQISGDLTPKQLKGLECLLTQPTIEKAAKAASISYAQLRRWLEQPLFADAYRRARTTAFETVLVSLQTTTQRAIETLSQLMENIETPASVRMNCAARLLDAGLRSRELFDTEQRLAEIEARFAVMNPQPPGGR